MTAYPSSLFPQHAALLEGSGIPVNIAVERGYVSVDTKARLKALGFSESQRHVPGLLVPIWNAAGERVTFQYRPDQPRERDGKPLKYETRPNTPLALDVPRSVHQWIDDPARPLFITEGARKADAAAARGLCCIALMGVWGFRGSNKKGGATALADWELVALNGRTVYIAFDSDVTTKPAVRDALVRLKAFLESRKATVEVVDLPAGDGGMKMGLDDYFAAGHTVDELLELARSDLPAPVKAEKQHVAYQGPPVVLATLLDDIAETFRRYVVMTSEQADALTLHTAHTHVVRFAETTPYLHAKSAEMRSGKSTLLKLCLELVARPKASMNISDAAIYRFVDGFPEAEPPTFIMDEVDRVFYASSGEQSRPELQGLINAGFQRGPLGHATRIVGEGSKMEAKDFRTFSPKVLGGIRDLPGTIADRTIPIVLKRKAPGETVARFRMKRVRAEAAPIRERLDAWATSGSVDVLADAEPVMPAGLHDREEDLWEPLFAVADLAGGDWPRRARAAALWIAEGTRVDDDSTGLRLLADVRSVFDEKDAAWIPTTDLVSALGAIEESPWATWHKGNPISPTKIASLLKPYGVRPNRQRVGEENIRGYKRAAFEDAWERYTPADLPPDGVQPGTAWNNPHGYAEDAGISTWNTADAVPGCEEAANPLGYADVPTCSGLERQNGRRDFGDGLTLDEVLTGNGAAEWLAADDLDDVSPGALCRYPEHRPSDRRGSSGKLICGICHPPAAGGAR